jgi:MFS family permease
MPVVADTKSPIFYLPAIALLILRMLEGLALGGEYGGAATYIAEHAPAHRRGFFTSFIQITATAGLFISVVVVLLLRNAMSADDFKNYGWRLAFLFSLVLVGVSLYIRISMRESPLFSRLKDSGKTSKNPIRESFGHPLNRRLVILALFGAVAGQGAVWYTAQFYSSTFMQGVMKVDFNTANAVVAVGLLLGTPFFIVMGALSDRIGRKKIIMAGCLIAAIGFFPIFATMYNAGPYLAPAAAKVGDAVTNPAYSVPLLVGCVFIMVILVTMVYGPIAAFLVELFPTKIRYTSMSLPYHIGNGWFGGLIPVLATALVTATKVPYAGLIFPIAIAAMTFVIGTLFVKDPTNVDLEADVEVGASMSGTSSARQSGR